MPTQILVGAYSRCETTIHKQFSKVIGCMNLSLSIPLAVIIQYLGTFYNHLNKDPSKSVATKIMKHIFNQISTIFASYVIHTTTYALSAKTVSFPCHILHYICTV